MPDWLYGWSVWWINFLHTHPAVWWTLIVLSVLLQLPRLIKRG